MRLGPTLLCLALLAACGADPQPVQVQESNCPAQATPSAACQAKGDAGLVQLSFSFEPAVPVRGTNSFTFHLTDAQGAALDDATLQLDLFMPAHGHGSSATPTVTALGGGGYRADDVVFPMSGGWNVGVQVTREALHDTVNFHVEVP